MSRYGTEVRTAVGATVIDAFRNVVPIHLRNLGIGKLEVKVVTTGVIQLKIWGINNPLPAYYTIKITENYT